MSSSSVRVYFDYSDYRSYFLMKVVESWGDLPVNFEWIALDGHSLRSMSGSVSLGEGDDQREYERMQAERFARYHGYSFSWPSEMVGSSLAIRVSSWVREHSPDLLVKFVHLLMDLVWGEGMGLNQGLILNCLETIGLDIEGAWLFSVQKDSFVHHDQMLHEAIAEGIFDVPVLLVGDELFWGYDHSQLMRYSVIRWWLSHRDRDLVLGAMSEFVSQLNFEAFSKLVERLGGGCELKAVSEDEHVDFGCVERSFTERPSSEYQIPIVPPGRYLELCFLRLGEGKIEEEIFSAYHRVENGKINFAGGHHVVFKSLDLVSHRFKRVKSHGGQLLVGMSLMGELGVLQVCGRLGGEVDLIWHRGGVEGGVLFFEDWRIGGAIFDGEVDVVACRSQVRLGCHALIVMGVESEILPVLCAVGLSCSRWVIGFGRGGLILCDGYGRYRLLEEEGDCIILQWPSRFSLDESMLYSGESARRLLLCESSLSVGSLSLGGDVEFSCKGNALFVVTENQRSVLSESRSDERFRIGDIHLTVVPLSGEEVLVVELVEYKLMQARRKAGKGGQLLLVNYWSELLFERLEGLRSLFKMLVGKWGVSLVVVVGTSAVELWSGNSSGKGYLVEKEGDLFVVEIKSSLVGV